MLIINPHNLQPACMRPALAVLGPALCALYLLSSLDCDMLAVTHFSLFNVLLCFILTPSVWAGALGKH